MRKSILLFLFLTIATTCISCGDDFFEEEIIYRNDSIIYVNDSVPNNNSNPGDTTKTDTTRTDSTKTDTTKTDTVIINKEYVSIQEITKYMNQSSSGSVQGADCYGDYLFQFQDKNAAVYVYNLKEKKYLGKVTLTPNNNNHCNNASFSRIFYQEGDEFPLIYVSGSGSGTYNQVQVYRITRNNSNFIIEQVQEIVLPKARPENNLYWTGVILDNESKCMYIYGNSNGAQIAKLRIPDITHFSTTLSDNDILEQFTLNKFTHQQGANIKDGLLYVFDGVPTWGDTNYLRITDLSGKKDIVKINIMEKGFKVEPEGTFFYNGELFCATNNSGIYKFKIVTN